MEYSLLVQPSERLTIIGKRLSGRTSFLEMLVGNLKRMKGKIYMKGKVAYLPEKHFFLKDTVRENIRFFNNNISNDDITEIYNELGLN